MMKKNVIILSIIFFLANCGFSPIYLKNENVNFSIEKVIFTGDRELNNFLKSKLKNYKNEETNNKFFIEARSEYTKVVLSKNTAGEVTNYQLEAKVTFLIKATDYLEFIKNKKIRYKIQSLVLESGYNGLTNFFIKKRFKIKVLDRFGNLFDLNNAFLSKTFASHNQEGLIISDKQTRNYDKLVLNKKAKKRKQSWGK